MKDINEFINRIPDILTKFMREYERVKTKEHYELIGKLLSFALATDKIYIPFDLKNIIPEFFDDELDCESESDSEYYSDDETDEELDAKRTHTIMHYAAFLCDKGLINLCIEKLDVEVINQTDKYGFHPIYYIAKYYFNYHEKLSKNTQEKRKRGTGMLTENERKKLARLKKEYRTKLNLFIQSDKVDINALVNVEHNLFHLACIYGDTSLIKELENNKKVDLNMLTTNGENVYQLVVKKPWLYKLLKSITEKRGVCITPNVTNLSRQNANLTDEFLDNPFTEDFAMDYLCLDTMFPDLSKRKLKSLTRGILKEMGSDKHSNDSPAVEPIIRILGGRELSGVPEPDTRTLLQTTNDENREQAFQSIARLPGIEIPDDISSFSTENRRILEAAKKRKVALTETTGGTDSEEASYRHGSYRDVLLPILDMPESVTNTVSSISHDDIVKNKGKYVIAHFRGINFNRKLFISHDDRREFSRANHTGRAVFSRMVYQNTEIDLINHLMGRLSEEDEKHLLQTAKTIRETFLPIFLKPSDYPPIGGEKHLHECLWHKIQQRFTNVASKWDKSGQISEIWTEIWEYLKKHEGLILKDADQNTKKSYKKIKKTGNLFCSFAKTPQHAVRYALGYSLMESNRHSRMDSRMRSNGQAKYQALGCVYVTLHTIDEYKQAKPSDVLSLHYDKKITMNYRYKHETEVSFWCFVDGENVVYGMLILYPDFSVQWSEAFEKQYGISKQQYINFKKRLAEHSARPHKIDLKNIFNRDWFDEDEKEYGLSEQDFNVLKDFYQFPLTREIEVQDEKLLKELKLIDRNEFLDKLNRKAIDKRLEKFLRDSAPSRVIKNEVRKILVEHYSKLLINIAKNEANKRGKQLIYVNPDGSYEPFNKSCEEVRNKIVETAKSERSKPLKRKAEQQKSIFHTDPKQNKKRKIMSSTVPSKIQQGDIRTFFPTSKM